jgi:hypothetical protein
MARVSPLDVTGVFAPLEDVLEAIQRLRHDKKLDDKFLAKLEEKQERGMRAFEELREKANLPKPAK